MITFKIIFPVYVCGMYIAFAWLTCKNYKSGQEGHPFFNAVVSYIWPLIVVLLPLGLLLYWIKRINRK